MWPTLITSILPSLLDKISPDPAKADETKLAPLKLQQEGALILAFALVAAVLGVLCRVRRASIRAQHH